MYNSLYLFHHISYISHLFGQRGDRWWCIVGFTYDVFIFLTAHQGDAYVASEIQAVAIAKPPFIGAGARYKRMRQLEKEENRFMQSAKGRESILWDKDDSKIAREQSFYMFPMLFLLIVETWFLPIRYHQMFHPSNYSNHFWSKDYFVCRAEWHAVRITRVRKTQILWCSRRFTPTPVQCWRRAWQTSALHLKLVTFPKQSMNRYGFTSYLLASYISTMIYIYHNLPPQARQFRQIGIDWIILSSSPWECSRSSATFDSVLVFADMLRDRGPKGGWGWRRRWRWRRREEG